MVQSPTGKYAYPDTGLLSIFCPKADACKPWGTAIRTVERGIRSMALFTENLFWNRIFDPPHDRTVECRAQPHGHETEGEHAKLRLQYPHSQNFIRLRRLDDRLWCVIIAPLGLPVVPDV